MKAIVIDKPGQASIHDISPFTLRPTYIRIKVHAVALNPTDWKHIDRIADAGAVVGCDVAGNITEIGSEVRKPVKVGDRVAAIVHGANLSNHGDGGFAEEVLARDGCFMHIPDDMTFEDAATLPVGVGTTGQGLYMSLGLPQPHEPKPLSPTPVLIYGGSTATGTIAIQFAALSGLDVLTTASPKNFSLLESLGAKKCFDYHDPDCGAQIRAYTNDKLRFVLDCITDEQSTKIAGEALSSSTEHGELRNSVLLPGDIKVRREDVKSSSTLLYNAVGEPYTKLGKDVVPDLMEWEFIREFYDRSEKLLADGKIKPHPKEVGKGFEGALEGLDRMRKGDYSAKKLVYVII